MKVSQTAADARQLAGENEAAHPRVRRTTMLARSAVICAVVVSCRGPSAAPYDPTEPTEESAQPELVPTAATTADVEVARARAAKDVVARPPAADAAPPSTAAPASSPPEAELEGCPASVTELPEVAWLDPDDRRLAQGELVVVSKSARRLVVFDDGKRTHCWKVALGFAPVGHKQVQGDGKTPEGWYRTSDKPWSAFDDAIAIHYPNDVDAREAKKDGRISRATHDKIVAAIKGGKVPPQSTALGGAILIHGGGTSFDWTLGCVALDDRDLVALREILPRGMRTDLLVVP
jgi:hypothetical protein